MIYLSKAVVKQKNTLSSTGLLTHRFGAKALLLDAID